MWKTWETLRMPAYMQGHKFFKHIASKRIAIADWSGEFPEDTDDGVLWLDDSRPIVVTFSSDKKLLAYLPLFRRDEKETQAPTDIKTAQFAIEVAHMSVRFEHPDLEVLASMLRR